MRDPSEAGTDMNAFAGIECAARRSARQTCADLALRVSRGGFGVSGEIFRVKGGGTAR